MADINLKTGNTDFVNISDGDITVGNQEQSVSNDEIVLDTPIVNQVISNTDIETTDDVPEGTSNLYYTDARVDARINEADIVIDDVYTNADFDTQLATKSTSHLSEGSNLYYTDTRSRLAISVQGDLAYNNTTGVISYTAPTVSNAVNSVNTQTGVVVLDTSHIAENTNLYYTDTRARQSISATGDISYNNTTGVISFTANASPVTSVNTLTGAVVLGTDNIAEGTNNLYYTDARVDARAQLKIDQILDSAPGSLDTLNELANALGDDPNFAATMTNNLALKLNITDFNSTFDTKLANKTTTDISEGTNLYYTDTRTNSAIDARVDKAFVDALNVDADTLDSLDSTQFTRKDVSNTQTGQITMTNASLRFSATNAPKTWSLINNSAGDLILHSGSSGTPEFIFRNQSVNSSAGAQILVNGATRVLTVNDLYTDTNVDTHLNTSNAISGQVLNWNGTDYTWVTPTTYTAYTNSDVDTHLNTSSATANQVLSWNGSDYTWTTVTGFDGQFSSLTGTPTTISGYGITDAFDGDYNNLTNKPTIFDGDYNNLSNKPTLFDGDYNSLTNTPTSFNGDFTNLTNKPTTINGYGITDAVYNDSNVGAQPIRQHYANQSSFPSASTWHGAMAHSHSDGAMYFAHGGSWNKLANDTDVTTTLGGLTDVNTSSIDNGYLVYSAIAGSHNIQALNIEHDTSPSLGGNLNTNSKTITGGLKLADNGIIEKFHGFSGSATTVGLDLNTSHSLFIPSATNNKTLALTNVSLANGEATNITVIWKQGTTPYMINALSINGLSAFVYWQGGSTPTGTANGVDTISFSIYSTGSSYYITGQSVSYS